MKGSDQSWLYYVMRKKLAGSGVQIRTLRGLGYLLEAEPCES